MNIHLNAEEKELWHLWKSIHATVFNRISQDISEKAEIFSEADFSVLARLHDLGHGELRQQELADSMQWSKSRLSHHLTRMQERGLIRRKPLDSEPGVLVTITAAGQSTIDRALPVHADAVRRHLTNHFTPEDIQAFRFIAGKLKSEE